MIFERLGDTLHPADEEAAMWLVSAQEGDQLECKALGQRKRSLDQNALYQKWARLFASHQFKKPEAEVTKAEHEAMKISLQRHCYIEMGWPFLIVKYPDAFGGDSKPHRAPTSDMATGELHSLLDWVQMFAARNGLILESQGEYAELKAKQVA